MDSNPRAQVQATLEKAAAAAAAEADGLRGAAADAARRGDGEAAGRRAAESRLAALQQVGTPQTPFQRYISL